MKDKYFALPCGRREAPGARGGAGVLRGCAVGPPTLSLLAQPLRRSQVWGGGGAVREDGCILGGLWSFFSDPWDSQEGAAAGPLLLGLHVVSDLEAGFIGLQPGPVFQLP